MYVAHAQNNFYYSRIVVKYATYGLLAVAAFLELSKIPTAD